MLLAWKIIIGVVIVAIGTAGTFVYLGYGLQNVSFEDLKLTGIKDLTLNSFTFKANLYLHNPSDLGVPVRLVEYDIIDQKSGEVVSSGIIPGFVLEKQVTTEIPFEQRVEFLPTASLGAQLLQEEKVFVLVKGRAFLDVAGAREKAIEFEKEVDIKEKIVGSMKSTSVGSASDVVANTAGEGLLG